MLEFTQIPLTYVARKILCILHIKGKRISIKIKDWKPGIHIVKKGLHLDFNQIKNAGLVQYEPRLHVQEEIAIFADSREFNQKISLQKRASDIYFCEFPYQRISVSRIKPSGYHEFYLVDFVSKKGNL